MTDDDAAAAKQKQQGVGCLVIILVIGGLIAIGALFGGSDDDETDADDLRYAAFEVCKDFVSDKLASPGTAVFRNYFEDDGEVSVTGTGSPTFVVRSSVDSENGFGALLRTDFVCEVGQAGGDQWRLAGLEFP